MGRTGLHREKNEWEGHDSSEALKDDTTCMLYPYVSLLRCPRKILAQNKGVMMSPWQPDLSGS